MNEQTKRMQILREVAFAADNFYEESKKLGQIAATALTSRKRSQITNLQGIASSALKVSEVLDYIKTQTARDKKASRDYGWHQNDFGLKLLAFFEQTLAQTKQNICSQLEKPDPKISLKLTPVDQQDIHLLLIREAVKQLTAQYEFFNFVRGDLADESNT